jgi:nucleotide-binding universal stress UspA family protein
VSRIIGRVVLGVSGSPENLHALRHAVQLARHYDATLIAVNAQPVRTRITRTRRASPIWRHAASLVVHAAFENGLGALPPDVECVLLAAPGQPGPALVDIADRANDVLVLGPARRRRGHRLLRQSVAAYCIDHAACSVLTVPPPPLASTAQTFVRTLF